MCASFERYIDIMHDTDYPTQGETGPVGDIGLPGDPGPQVMVQVIDSHGCGCISILFIP